MTKKAATRQPFDPPEWPAMQTKLWTLKRIKPYEANPRTHPPAQITLLAKILIEHGPDQPIVVDESGVILKGHGRLMAAKEAKLSHFPVAQRHGLTESEKRAIRIQDNQVALLSGWDSQLIGAEITALKLDGYDVELLGFGPQQLVSFTTTPKPPSGFPEVTGDNLKTDYCCPKCRYRWSGNPGL